MSTGLHPIAQHALVVLASREDLGPEYIADKRERLDGLDAIGTLRWLGCLDRSATAELASRLRTTPARLDALISTVSDMSVRDLTPAERELIGLAPAHSHPGM